MQMSNSTYDKLKFIALLFIPALATFILTVTAIWNIPYGEPIAGTVTAIGVLLGAFLKKSSGEYNQALDQDRIDAENEA